MAATDRTLNARQNNFDTLRLIAAIMVLLSHALLVTFGTNDHDFLHRVSRSATSIGALAVDVFFAVSGYLITSSYIRSQKPVTFILARGARILPALIVVVIFTAFVLGPLVTALSPHDYLTSAGTWRFVWRNLLVRWETMLPGVFSTNPLPGVANGSIWTLEFEVDCYAVILCLGVFRLLGKRSILATYVVSLAASAFWLGQHFGPFLAVFMGGALMRVWQPPLKGWIAILCAMAWGAGLFLPAYRLFAASFGVYVILFLALSPAVRLPNLARRGDLSYGVYLWAFPVQQCVVMGLGGNLGWYWNVVISMPIVLALAALSWRYVEAPVLRKKTEWRRRPDEHARSSDPVIYYG